MKPRKYFTDADVALIRLLYPTHTAEQIAQQLERGVASVRNKIHQIGLYKPAEVKRAQATHRVTEAGKATRFQKGQTSWNAGTHWVAGGRSPETRFKPGSKPVQTLPVGSTRLSKNGTLERKYQEAPGNPSQRWRPEHRLVWEAANGPVPTGHIIVFKAGMWTNVAEEITLDKLECISRKENALRNTPWNDPAIGHLVVLKGAINRHVNRIAKQSKQEQEHDQPSH